MKIILVIYIISWLCLIALYLSDKLQNKEEKEEKKPSSISFELPKSKNDRSITVIAYFFMFLFAPLVIIVGPLMIYKKNKIKKKEKLKREQKEKEEQEQRKQCIDTFNRLAHSRRNEFEYSLWITARNLFNLVKSKHYGKIFKVLDLTSLTSGAELGIMEAEKDNASDVSSLYVRKQNGDKDKDILKFLTFEESPSGAWQAYLLTNIWHYLPMGWHGDYDKRTYLITREDVNLIKPIDNTFNTEVLRNYIVEPEIYGEYDRFAVSYYISCCYWTDFGGLKREYIKIRIRQSKIWSIQVFDEKTIYKYDCGIDL